MLGVLCVWSVCVMTASNALIKSRYRVQEHGEVFTPPFIVADMLDLVDAKV